MMKRTILLATLITAMTVTAADAQVASGGSFSIEKAAIAGGGGNSTAGSFDATGTTGQSAAGNIAQNQTFTQPAGFWVRDAFVPTAATVTVGGRVTTSAGNGIRNAQITLTDAMGRVRTATTASFGYYSFTEVEVGQTYVLTVRSKRYHFTNPSVVLAVTEEIAAIDFTAID